MLLYNIGIYFYGQIVALAQRYNPKAKLWVEGRRALFERMREAMDGATQGEVVWIHVASLGEFEQGRPIIEAIKECSPSTRILLTFFSPSGYQVRKDYKGADYIFYLPLDTPSHAREFLDIAKPSRAIFVKYEYWLNMLFELDRRSVESYVVSANFRANSIFFKPWGALHRKALRRFKTIFVQSNASRELLATIGVDRVVVAGDTRFDRVAQIVESATPIELVERFAGGDKLFVAGSTWPADIDIITPLIKRNPGLKFLLVPHEVDAAHMEQLETQLNLSGVDFTRYSDFREGAQVLIIDTIGLLSRVYRYAKCAYIGGGFGAGIHNTLEATVYGLPIAFGTRYEKFAEAVELVGRGVARSVSSSEELHQWLTMLLEEPAKHRQISATAAAYTAEQCGATEQIMQGIGY